MGLLREHNGSAPKLYIEFEDDDEDEEPAGERGAVRLVSEREVIGSLPAQRAAAAWKPRRTWTLLALPRRYRRLAAVTVLLAGLAATISNALVAQAAQRDAARSSVAVVDAAYSPSADDQSLNLVVDLTDPSPTAVTVTQLQARQSDLLLTYVGTPVDLMRTQQLEIVLSGAYDCSAVSLTGAATGAPDSRPGVLHMTIHTGQGNVTSVDVPLPASAKLPADWQAGRAAYCAMWWNN